MGRRSALLVGTYDYSDTSLQRLKAPGHDVESLAAVLADPQIAGFTVTTLINKPHYVVGEAIGNFYDGLRRDDLALLYISGHGLKDDQGRLHLAMTNSRRAGLWFTAIGAEQINDAMNNCSSRQKVLILDCCYGGAFPSGWTAKGDPEVNSLERFQGRGRVVLTASDAAQYSFEGDGLSGTGSSSLFTRYLVEGIQTGKADLDGDGDISLDELYSYVHDRVIEDMPAQRPKKQEDVEGRIVIARNVGWELPTHIQNAITSPIALDRRAAIQSLAYLSRVGNEDVQRRVLEQIEKMLDDDSRMVSADAAEVIRQIGGAGQVQCQPNAPTQQTGIDTALPMVDQRRASGGNPEPVVAREFRAVPAQRGDHVIADVDEGLPRSVRDQNVTSDLVQHPSSTQEQADEHVEAELGARQSEVDNHELQHVEAGNAEEATELDRLYAQARAREGNGEWSAAAAGFAEVVAVDSTYLDARTRQLACENRQQIAKLHNELRINAVKHRWEAVIEIDERLRRLDDSATDPDGLVTKARAALAQAATAARLESLYNNARTSEYSGDYAEAAGQFSEIHRIDSDYLDVAERLEACHQAAEGDRRIEAVEPLLLDMRASLDHVQPASEQRPAARHSPPEADDSTESQPPHPSQQSVDPRPDDSNSEDKSAGGVRPLVQFLIVGGGLLIGMAAFLPQVGGEYQYVPISGSSGLASFIAIELPALLIIFSALLLQWNRMRMALLGVACGAAFCSLAQLVSMVLFVLSASDRSLAIGWWLALIGTTLTLWGIALPVVATFDVKSSAGVNSRLWIVGGTALVACGMVCIVLATFGSGDFALRWDQAVYSALVAFPAAIIRFDPARRVFVVNTVIVSISGIWALEIIIDFVRFGDLFYSSSYYWLITFACVSIISGCILSQYGRWPLNPRT